MSCQIIKKKTFTNTTKKKMFFFSQTKFDEKPKGGELFEVKKRKTNFITFFQQMMLFTFQQNW